MRAFKYHMSVLKNIDNNIYKTIRLEINYAYMLHIPLILFILTFFLASIIIFSNVFSDIQLKYLIFIELLMIFLGLSLASIFIINFINCIKVIQHNIPESLREKMDKIILIEKERDFLKKNNINNRNLNNRQKKRL